ncbi:MAG: nickel-responsive transcriptional regulator NikR [Candidatus Bathyarchaeota archaeon]|nr:nickel-responsive transcriptional regulator NikR [Candidatus Bathyarchaeota archaeon]
MSIISLSIPKPLIEKIDTYIKEQGYANRSEIVRQALRAYLSEAKRIEELKGNITATITIIYQKGHRTSGQTTDSQHHFNNVVLTFLHTHIEEGICIEVIVAKGDCQTIKEFIKTLKTNRQVAEVKVTLL